MKKIVFLFLVITLNLTAFSKNKTWTCINENGETIFRTEAIHVKAFKNGLAEVYKSTLVDDKWVTGRGFINTKGEIVIPAVYHKAKDFNAEVTWVKRKEDTYYTLIDRKGNVIPTGNYDKVKNFYPERQSLCAVYQDGKMGFVNTKGVEVVPCKYIGSSLFSEGLASVCLATSIKGEYGFINEKGEEVIPLKFIQSGTSTFENGMARAMIDGATVFINKKGAVVFKTDKGNIQGSNFGRVLVITKPNRKGWGWVNLDDEFVIKPTYDHATNFNDDGFAIVEKNGLKGVIDTLGKVILPLKYESVYATPTKDGYFMGMYPSKDGSSLANAKKDYYNVNLELIDLNGVKYVSSAVGTPYMIYANLNGRLGYLNRNFEEYISVRYSRAYPFSEGFAWVLD